MAKQSGDGRGGTSIRASRAPRVVSPRKQDTATPNVAYMRYELGQMLPIYQLIRDCIAGEFNVKQHDRLWFSGQTTAPFGMSVFSQSDLYGWSTWPYYKYYLPKPNATDKSIENSQRYRDYIERAVFYAVTRRTLEGFAGALFLRAPVIEMPEALDALEKDATGTGVSLLQFGKQLTEYVLGYGRAGLLADYPVTDDVVTLAQKQAGDVRSNLTVFPPWQCINWRVRQIGGISKLSLVVIAETAVVNDDGFKEDHGEQYRVLYLTPDNKYCVSLWRRVNDKSNTDDTNSGVANIGELVLHEETYPKDANGNYLDHIPFTFVGPVDNGPSVDHAPCADLASINIAHYRNSADFEESVYWTGQPTPVFTGLTQEWVEDVLGGSVNLGARSAVLLPINGTAELLQADTNQLAQEAMKHKEEQMLALGAKLIEERRVQRTATEAGIDDANSQSVLASSGANVSQAILWALRECAAFEGVEYTDDTLKFEINTELDLIKLSPEARKQLLSEWQAGAISWTEYRHNLHRSGIAVQSDDEATKEIKENPPLSAQLELAAIDKAATNDKVQP